MDDVVRHAYVAPARLESANVWFKFEFASRQIVSICVSNVCKVLTGESSSAELMSPSEEAVMSRRN